MKVLRSFLAVLLLAATALCAPASATSYSTDQSDLWWNPAESGWGIQFVHRGSLIFATMFVYDQSKIPIWYGGTLYPTGASFTWSGANYETTGPWFGQVPFDPAQFASQVVGTMTWTATSTSTGTLSYTVNGVSVTKLLTRQFIANDDFSGTFQGAIHRAANSCSNPANDGTTELGAGLFIDQVNTSMSVTVSDSQGIICTYSGTLSQAGQMGSISGSFSCNSGDSGNFNMFELQVNISGITGRFARNSNVTSCVSNGWFGAMRNSP
ncbi:MAG: hypothetical protein ABI900_01375 [Betaproteobacteria bacterium]